MNKKNSKRITIEPKQKQDLAQLRKIDNTSLKQQIFELRNQVIYFKIRLKQKEEVEKDSAKNNQKYMKESSQIQKTIKDQQEQLVQLQNNYKIMYSSFENNQKRIKQNQQNQQQKINKRRLQQKEQLMKNINNLENKIKHIKQFSIRQSEYINTLNNLGQKDMNNKVQQAKDIQNIVNQHKQQRVQIQKTIQKEITNIRQLQMQKIQQSMNRQTQIKKQNQIIQEQIALCQSQKQQLEYQYQNAIKENQTANSNNPQQILSGQASQTYQRSLRVIKLQQKLAKLKQFLTIQMKKLDEQYKSNQHQLQMTRKHTQQNVNKMQNWLKMKEKDLKKMKACAQMVLNQRSNLQSYLLEVFHQNSTIDYHDPANINIILRNLFVKINSRKQPVSYKDHLSNSTVSYKSIQ